MKDQKDEGLEATTTTMESGNLIQVQGGRDGHLVEDDKHDEKVIFLWMARFGSDRTRRAYSRDVQDWLNHIAPKYLLEANIEDAITWQRSLEEYSRNTQARKVAAVKSLYTFMHKLGITQINLFTVVRTPSRPSQLVERILTKGEVLRILAVAHDNKRDLLLLHILYYGALRAAEARGLNWGDLVEREDLGTGQLSVRGKGEKNRPCPLPAPIWENLLAMKPEDSQPLDPIFVSRKKGRISTSQIRRIVNRLAAKAEIGKKVSPHWFRHAHATHSLEGGASIVTISAFLGHGSLATTYGYLHARPHDASSFYLPI